MMRRPSILQLTTAAALLNVMYVQIALGQGVIRDSIGAISSGRGGTNIAHNDNLSLILDNPAGLANLPEKERLDFGLDVLTTDLDYTDPDNNANAQFMPFPLPCFGYAKRQGNLTLGFGVLIPAGFGATYDLKHALYGKREYSSLGALVNPSSGVVGHNRPWG